VFISLVVSFSMMILFAQCCPYLNASDDVLGQICQLSITFALAIGLLEKAASSFQGALYGVVKMPAMDRNLGSICK